MSERMYALIISVVLALGACGSSDVEFLPNQPAQMAPDDQAAYDAGPQGDDDE